MKSAEKRERSTWVHFDFHHVENSWKTENPTFGKKEPIDRYAKFGDRSMETEKTFLYGKTDTNLHRVARSDLFAHGSVICEIYAGVLGWWEFSPSINKIRTNEFKFAKYFQYVQFVSLEKAWEVCNVIKSNAGSDQLMVECANKM